MLCSNNFKYNVVKETFIMLDFSYVYSETFYGIIFWGNTANTIEIFRMGK